MKSETSTSFVFNEIVQLLKEGKVYPAKLKKVMDRQEIKSGVKYYPRFLIPLSARFVKAHRLEEGDFVYVLPAYLFDSSENLDNTKKDNDSAKLQKIVEAKPDLFNREIKNSENIKRDGNNAKVQKTVEAKPVIIRAKGKEYKKARIVIDLPKEYIGKKFKLVEI